MVDDIADSERAYEDVHPRYECTGYLVMTSGGGDVRVARSTHTGMTDA